MSTITGRQKRSFDDIVERALTRLLKPAKRGDNGHGNSEKLTNGEKIKLLAVAVRFSAVKKGLDGTVGAAFDEGGKD